ncbi:hypothetical protein Tco_1264798 [Tanacetum coccineum]
MLLGNGENLNRKSVQPRSPSHGFTDQNLFSFDVGQPSPKQVYGTPMKTLLAEELLNETSSRKRSPSLIAKLMGLEGLPSPQTSHKQQKKLSDNSHKNTGSVGGKRNENSLSHQLDKKSTTEQQYCKDVYEDPEASHVGNQLYSSPMSAKRRSTKQELGYIQERCDEMLKESIAIKNKLERVDSNSDFMLNYLHKSDSVYGKHLHDPQDNNSVSYCTQITLLKPSNYVRHETHGKGSKEERENLNYHAPVSRQRNEDVRLGYCHNANNPRRSSRYQLERKDAGDISPTRIVVLKPNVAKIYNDDISFRSPDERRKSTESEYFSSGIRQGEYEIYKGPPSEVRSSRHNSREAREIARKITSQMKEGFENGNVNLLRGYAASESLYISASESEMMAVSSRNSFDRSDRPRRSSSMSESDVIMEAKKRMSRRWKTYGYKDVGMVGKGSTLEEMLSDPNCEIRQGRPGCVVGRFGVNDEYVLLDNSGISGKDCRRDRYLRSRSRSLPSSSRNRSRKESDYYEVHADEKIVVHNEPRVNRNAKHREDLQSNHSRYSKRCQSSQHCNACIHEFDDLLPESHYRRKPIETYFENGDSAEQESLVSDIQGATANSASVIDEFRVSYKSSNELSPRLSTCMLGDAKSFAVDEDGSNSQEPYSAKSQDTVSFHLSGPEPESSEGSNEVNQHGEALVLEIPPTEDVSSGSDCFESVSTQLLELRKQLQLLKMESGSHYDSLNDEDVEQGSFFALSESDNWESAYLTDFLQNSGFYDHDPYTFMTTWYSADSQDVCLFDHLEKKYSQDSTPWSKRNPDDTDRKSGLKKQLLFSFRRLLARQEKEASEEFEETSIDNDPDWFHPVKEIDIVGKQIAEVLVNDLILELVTL